MTIGRQDAPRWELHPAPVIAIIDGRHMIHEQPGPPLIAMTPYPEPRNSAGVTWAEYHGDAIRYGLGLVNEQKRRREAGAAWREDVRARRVTKRKKALNSGL